MTLQSIYDAALRLVCEEADGSEDYEERASYLLPTFCAHCRESEARYRKAHDMGAGSIPTSLYWELTEEFPLCDVFVAPATYYLAAMLALDENETLSEKLFALYTDALASIETALPTQAAPITDRYKLL